MKTHTVMIQTNAFNAIEIPTTQEDNHAHIEERYDLFRKFSQENNGNETSEKVGHLVIYRNKDGAVFHGSIRYNFPKSEIVVKKVN